ncbi:sulfur oxidation c-type cytochrome SoxX [Hyphomonas sp.]|uniref:sulfur oxidation c-type cytochrome SoxX n=1 Tax=Hyphomonas sp. TaxID=87 RepID=UPI0030FA5AF5
MMRCGTIAVLTCLLTAACTPDSSHLVSPNQIDGDSIPLPLADTITDAAHGKALFVSRDGGHCVLCHQVAGLEAEFQGDVGPALTGIGSRLSPGQLRLRVVDYEQVRPGVLMPSYYRTHDLYQVSNAHEGEPVLSAEDVEDLIAYLSSLKEPDA